MEKNKSVVIDNHLHSDTITLHPVPPLLFFISDIHLLLTLPTVAYWAYGLFFYWIDKNGYFPQYRLHTPAEVLKRNKVPMSTVIRSISFYQVVTTALGFWLMRNGTPDLVRGEDVEVAAWLFRIREIQQRLGVLPHGLAKALGADVVVGPMIDGTSSTTVLAWETWAAKTLYRYIVPTCQYALAIFVADTWQYFEHRVVHMNHYLYSTCSSRSTSKS